jgi:hypothetical protein
MEKVMPDIDGQPPPHKIRGFLVTSIVILWKVFVVGLRLLHWRYRAWCTMLSIPAIGWGFLVIEFWLYKTAYLKFINIF